MSTKHGSSRLLPAIATAQLDSVPSGLRKELTMHSGQDYWKNYMLNWFGSDLIARWERTCEEQTIRSNNTLIHVETYIHDSRRPTLVFSHGIAGYARLLVPFVMPLYDRGVNVICPDLQGYGYNLHRRGDFTWKDHVQNLVDTVRFYKRLLKGPFYLGGASMGGPLAYETASHLEQVSGLICWCLWSMGDRDYIQSETTLKGTTLALLPILQAACALVGRLRIKTYSFVSYDSLTATPEFNRMIRNDPQAGILITIRGALSLVLDSQPSCPYERWTAPIVIFQPGADLMTPPKYSRAAFQRIGSQCKQYIELPGAAHFPTEKRCYEFWAEEVRRFMSRVAGGTM